MRTRKLSLAVTAIVALGVAVMPAVSSAAISDFEKKQNAKIKKANNKVNNAIEDLEALEGDLSESNTTQNNKNASQDETIASLQSTVDTIVAGVPTIVNGLTALQAGLTTVGDALTNQVSPALTAINDALQDETTGLVGLNLARPQFGVFQNDGDFLGGTGEVASGPNQDAIWGGRPGGPGLAGLYVIDFNNDVSSRMYSVNVFPSGPGVTTPVGTAVSCESAPTLCGAAISGAGSDADPDRVAVQIGNGLSSAPSGFSVTAISG